MKTNKQTINGTILDAAKRFEVDKIPLTSTQQRTCRQLGIPERQYRLQVLADVTRGVALNETLKVMARLEGIDLAIVRAVVQGQKR